MSSLASRECNLSVAAGNERTNVSNQVSSLASRESDLESPARRRKTNKVSNQVSSLASRECVAIVAGRAVSTFPIK